jgi:hypothetical protein
MTRQSLADLEAVMKKATLALALLMAVPLAAQKWEVGVFLGQQSYKSVSDSGLTVELEKKTVASIRFGYSVFDLGPALFQLTAGYQPQANTDAKMNGTTIPDFSYDQKHWSVGAMFNFKAVVAVGAGLEYRSESLSVSGGNSTNVSTTYGRPWARLNAGYAIPSPMVKPFFGVEVAAPLTSKSYDPNASSEDALKMIAPKLQIGLYAGIRF